MATMLSDRTRLAQGYFAEGDRYLRANYRIRRRAELAGEVLGPLTGKHIVDLGCGDGAVSASFAEARHITFVDSAADMVGRARSGRANRPATYLVDDLHAVTLDDPGDVVMCLGVLAHVDDSRDTMRAIARNLASDGRALVQFSPAERAVNRVGLPLLRMRTGLGYRATATRDVVAAATEAGLRVVARRDHLLVIPGTAALLGKGLPRYDRAVCRARRLRAPGPIRCCCSSIIAAKVMIPRCVRRSARH